MEKQTLQLHSLNDFTKKFETEFKPEVIRSAYKNYLLREANAYFEKEVGLLRYTDFCDENEDEINCIISESGMDRELDFDEERFVEDAYNEGSHYGYNKNYPSLVFCKEQK